MCPQEAPWVGLRLLRLVEPYQVCLTALLIGQEPSR